MKIFMIEQGNLKEISKPIFSTGDVYLIDDEKTIYIWIGSKSSVDEKTSGAAQARTLDQQRGGAAKIITIDQGQETPEFLELVAPGGAMKIVEKNVAKTLLKDVTTGDFAGFEDWKNILYRISSEEFDNDINAMKMVQVPFSKDSLDSEDCFIADLGNKVYVWQGNACNVKEKVKAGQWARGIDADRAGDQNEKIFEEGDDAEFITALEKGVDYKESDAVQIKAESILEGVDEDDKIAASIQPEHKTEIKEMEEPKMEEKKEEPKVEEKPAEPATVGSAPSTGAASAAAPGIPGKMADDGLLTIEKQEGRRICPKCGQDRKQMIHESIDKANIILDYPRMYGKKYKILSI